MLGDTGFHPFKGKVSKRFTDSVCMEYSGLPDDRIAQTRFRSVSLAFHRLSDANTLGEKHLSPDDPYLSYHDILLTKEDIDTLKDDWLTDNIIAFWEEYLEHEHLSRYPLSHIVLLRPSMSFMLIQTPDPTTLREALPNFSRTTHIFLPINDCRNVEIAEGGTHWSLLVVSVVDGSSFHYDSLHPSNRNEAITASRKLGQLLGKELKFMDLSDSPRQDNSSDCGVFVCAEMRHLLLKRLLQADSKHIVNMSLGGMVVDAAGARREILKTIEFFRKEGEKRRSRSLSPHRHGDSHTKGAPRIE